MVQDKGARGYSPFKGRGCKMGCRSETNLRKVCCRSSGERPSWQRSLEVLYRLPEKVIKAARNVTKGDAHSIPFFLFLGLASTFAEAPVLRSSSPAEGGSEDRSPPPFYRISEGRSLPSHQRGIARTFVRPIEAGTHSDAKTCKHLFVPRSFWAYPSRVTDYGFSRPSSQSRHNGTVVRRLFGFLLNPPLSLPLLFFCQTDYNSFYERYNENT